MVARTFIIQNQDKHANIRFKLEISTPYAYQSFNQFLLNHHFKVVIEKEPRIKISSLLLNNQAGRKSTKFWRNYDECEIQIIETSNCFRLRHKNTSSLNDVDVSRFALR